MPIYEYRCTNCGHQQEFLQKVSDAPQTRCTQCGQETLSKMVTAAGFHLKGSGWYATDFKGGASKPASKEGASETKPEGGNASAGETKPESSKETAPACGSGACPACQKA